MNPKVCAFCDGESGVVLWRDEFLRVVLADEPDYPGFCRVVLNEHAREATDLAPPARRRMMDVVFATEEAVRATFSPWKINLASLGNVVPHVHWHVVPRRRDDPRFPDPIWGPPRRETPKTPVGPTDVERLRSDLSRRLTALDA